MTIPSVDEIVRAVPSVDDALLVESFGSPWSPLDETHLQIDLVRALRLPCILVSSTSLGCIGRTLQTLSALETAGVEVRVVALLGPDDPFAREQLVRHQRRPVISLTLPEAWTHDGIERASQVGRPGLDEAAAALQSTTVLPTPSSLRERDRAAVWHPYTSLSAAPPLVCVGAQDEFIHLEDGTRLVDGISSWWTILHGHRDPDLLRALQVASGEIDHVLFAGVTHPWGVELAELLLASAGMKDGRVFYSDNGSTAVEVALKMAYQFWCLEGQSQRTRFVGFQNGYHGDTFGAMAVSRDPVFFGRFGPLLFQADIVPLDAEALDQHLRTHASTTAAVIVEPLVQGAGGMRMHTPETLADLCRVAQQHEVLFIADEVMTGGGRTGSTWAFERARIAPDLVCAAKTLTGGVMPLAATLASARIVAPFESAEPRDAFFHGHSFTGHPLACALALASCKKLAHGGMDQVRRIETFWRSRLESWRGRPGVKDVRIQGTIAALEVESAGGYLAEAGRRMRETALREGVFLRPLGNVLYTLPPLCTSTGSLERIIRAIDGGIEVGPK